jgi:two-component system, response regulator
LLIDNIGFSNRHEAKMSQGPLEILLIEDDPDDAELAIYALKKGNVINNVLHIDDGEQAMQYLFSDDCEIPRVILLDLRMPRVDGVAILAKLKAHPIKQRLPVIALISSREGKNYVESYNLRADAYIVKPVDLKKFFDAISELGLNWPDEDPSLTQ